MTIPTGATTVCDHTLKRILAQRDRLFPPDKVPSPAEVSREMGDQAHPLENDEEEYAGVGVMPSSADYDDDGSPSSALLSQRIRGLLCWMEHQRRLLLQEREHRGELPAPVLSGQQQQQPPLLPIPGAEVRHGVSLRESLHRLVDLKKQHRRRAPIVPSAPLPPLPSPPPGARIGHGAPTTISDLLFGPRPRLPPPPPEDPLHPEATPTAAGGQATPLPPPYMPPGMLHRRLSAGGPAAVPWGRPQPGGQEEEEGEKEHRQGQREQQQALPMSGARPLSRVWVFGERMEEEEEEDARGGSGDAFGGGGRGKV